MGSFIDKIDENKIKQDTDEYVLDITKEFLDYMNWNDSKLNRTVTVKEILQVFGFIFANLMLTVNTDFETFVAGMSALGERSKNLEYEVVKNLYFIMSMQGYSLSWREAYKQYSEEFDELNKNEKTGEDASVEVETDTENKEKK